MTDSAEVVRPWYRHPIAMVCALLFVTPAWVTLVLTDRRASARVKWALIVVVAVIAGGGAWWYATRIGTIDFGSTYTSSADGFSIQGRRSTFRTDDRFAFVAHFGGPARTTRLELLIAQDNGDKGEALVDRATLDIANPQFDTVFNELPTPPVGPGRYVMRLLRGDKILAEGRFTVEPVRAAREVRNTSSSQRATAPCLRYGSTSTISGTLDRQTHEGRAYFFLVPIEAVCTEEVEPPDSAQQDVRLIQLVLEESGYAELRPFLGRPVTVSGSLFGSVSVHHHAPLLMDNVKLHAAPAP
jgi:hypothetical protein